MKWLQGIFAITALILWASPTGDPVYGQTVSTTVVTTAATITLTQLDYRWYANLNALTPTASLASENTATSTPETGTVVRLRMNAGVTGLDLPTGATFSLQFSTATSSGFADVGTSTGAWIFHDNSGVADGQTIDASGLVLSSSDVGASYGESNPSAGTPNAVSTGQEAEWDWVIKNNSAATSSAWYFRMINSSGTAFTNYTNFPALTAVEAVSSTTGGGKTVIITGGGGFALERPPKRPPSPCDDIRVQRIDLSGDCKVDIVDLSILLYYYGQSGAKISLLDFNDSGSVDFPDISVMMFYWTR